MLEIIKAENERITYDWGAFA